MGREHNLGEWCDATMAKRGVPAEGARLEAGDARLEARLGRGAALFVGELRLWRERLYVYTMCEYGQKRMGCDQGFEFGDGPCTEASAAA